MRSTTALYKRLLGDLEHTKEVKAVIAGTEYSQNELISCAVSNGLFSEFEVGQCVSMELDLIIQPQAAVPKMARIDLYVRLVLGDEFSEWVPKGTYYLDTRDQDEVSGLLTIHGYDGMLKAEQTYQPEGDTGGWPRSQQAVVGEICARMGVELDSRTVIDPSFQVEYPNDYTMREVLGYIGASHGGNWFMTDENRMLLLPLGALPAETSFLVDGADGTAILMGEVRLIV